jgi:hypothetical protein
MLYFLRNSFSTFHSLFHLVPIALPEVPVPLRYLRNVSYCAKKSKWFSRPLTVLQNYTFWYTLLCYNGNCNTDCDKNRGSFV